MDPDAASRTNRGDTTTGDNVGTKQADEFKSHFHGYDRNRQISTAGAPGSINVWADGGSLPNTQNTGGNETRPKNINMMYIIKY